MQITFYYGSKDGVDDIKIQYKNVKSYIPKVKLCPLCGKKPFTGILSAMSCGVRCKHCKLEIHRNYPFRTSKAISETTLNLILTRIAVQAWNRRYK